MAVTISDIAKAAGVHQSTVSTVLNKSKSTIKVSEQTKRKILDVASSLNYRPNLPARALATGRSFSFGMICGDIHSPNYSELASIALKAAEDMGYHLLISVTGWVTAENNLKCLETLMSRGVDGVLFWGSGLNPGGKLYEQIVNNQYPIVAFYDEIEGISSVIVDWDPGMDEALKKLVEKGHKRIRFIGHCDSPLNRYRKRISFLKACENYDVIPEEIYVTSARDPHETEELAKRMAKDSSCPSAFIVVSDFMAFGLIRGFHSSGLRIPEDIAVVGIDGTQMGQYITPALTTIAQDRTKMISMGLEMLKGMVDKKEKLGQKVIAPTFLLEREYMKILEKRGAFLWISSD